ncbi:MAG: hemerythrin domain-containing protein [Pseudohongiellaceae bacterium]
MNEILDKLHQDHIHMARVLDLIDRELTRFNKEDESSDLPLVHDAMHYLTQYGDQCHHPLEDRVFAHLQEINTFSTEAVARLHDEHQTLYARGKAFRDAVGDVESDATMTRDAFMQLARDYLDLQREHLNFEEATVFPLAREHMDQADWQAIARDEQTAHDPLFGSEVEQAYQRLKGSL